MQAGGSRISGKIHAPSYELALKTTGNVHCKVYIHIIVTATESGGSEFFVGFKNVRGEGRVGVCLTGVKASFLL